MNNFKAIALLTLSILFCGNCFAQKTFENQEMVLRSITGNKIISIKEGKYIEVVVNQHKLKGRLHIVNDSLIELKNNKTLIDSIDKIRIGHLGSNIAFAAIGGVVGIVALGGGTIAIIEALSTDEAGIAGLEVFFSLPLFAIGTFTVIFIVKKISNIIWRHSKNYRIQIQAQ